MNEREGLEKVEIDDEMRYFSSRDLATRSFVGTYIYLLAWAAIVIPSNFYATAPDLCLFFTLAFLMMALIRGTLIKNFERIYLKKAIYWKLCFYPTVLGTALLWGILCRMSLIDPRFESFTLAIVIATAGLASGGVVALLSSRMLTLGLSSALILPTGLLLFLPSFDNITIVLIFLLYWLGMYSITKVQYHEYWLGLKSNFLIKRHAIILEQLNTLDGLTGLKNRKYFDESLSKEMKSARRAQSHLSLLLIDIDHFKMINDTYGHLVGDDCLRDVSQLLQQQLLRKTDTIARYGGEEFAIILPSNNQQMAIMLAEKIRQSIESLSFQAGREKIHLTVSIGVASIIPQLSCSKESLILKADKALYLAKNAGRNRVMEAQTDENNHCSFQI